MKKELWLIWKDFKTRLRYKVGILIYDGNSYIFKYTNPELDDALSKGFTFFPGFIDLKKEYISKELFSNISCRLLNKERSDYLYLLNMYNLDRDSTDFEILCATKGRLITDNYEFVPAFDENGIEFDVAGTRHCKDFDFIKNDIKVNDKIELILESNNEYDKNAIRVIYKNNKEYCLGYVPKYYSKDLTNLLNEGYGYSALIKTINLDSKFRDEDVTISVKLLFENK